MPLGSFVLPEGLEIKPWAVSPMLFNPTNMDTDQKGRIWVTEGVNYRRKSDRQPNGDRIVILEDTDGDGKADSSKVFWQDPELVSPLGIGVFDNVVIVSQPPNLIKLTDVNRDLKFDPASGDTREVLLTGFNGKNHDHSLHSLTAGPDGKWYFNQGNTCGFSLTSPARPSGLAAPTIKAAVANGRLIPRRFPATRVMTASSMSVVSPSGGILTPPTPRLSAMATGIPSSKPSTRVDSYFKTTTMIHRPAAPAHVLEHGNAGFFSNDGTRSWQADKRPGQDTPTAHWRQENPGSMPAGDVYGGGSPTGIAFYENGALGDKFNGTLLSCEAARNVVFGYQPAPDGAGFKLDRTDFLTTHPEKEFDGADFTGGAKKHAAAADKDKQRSPSVPPMSASEPMARCMSRIGPIHGSVVMTHRTMPHPASSIGSLPRGSSRRFRKRTSQPWPVPSPL